MGGACQVGSACMPGPEVSLENIAHANDTILLTEYLSVDIATRERRVSEVHLFSLKPGKENTSIISSM